MPLVWPTKGPTEVLDYDIDWTQRLESGDGVVSSTWSITQTDGALTILSNPSPSFIPTTTKVWLSGGTVGQAYTLLNTVNTVNGDIMAQSVLILVRVK